MGDNQKKKYLLFGLLFTLPFLLSALFSISKENGIDWIQTFVVGTLMDIMFAAAVFLYHKNKPKNEETDSTELCDRVTGIMFTFRQSGAIVESVTVGPSFIEVEHIDKEGNPAEKSVFSYAAWGIKGNKTYLHAAKAARDYLGLDYSLMMAGDFIIINRKKEKADK